jgi:hypothetical protein
MGDKRLSSTLTDCTVDGPDKDQGSRYVERIHEWPNVANMLLERNRCLTVKIHHMANKRHLKKRCNY